MGAAGLLVAVLIAAASGVVGGVVLAQSRPLEGPQREARPPVASTATVVSPAEGEIVAGDLQVVIEVPSGAEARRYSLEVAYWDSGRNAWVYLGLLGDEFAGGPRATRRVPAEELKRFSATANRWQLRARVTDPPWSWGPWRTFGLGAAPAAAAAEASRATGLPTVQGREAPAPDATAPPAGRQPPPGEPGPARSSGLPAVQGREVPAGTAAAPPSGRQPPAGSPVRSEPPDRPAGQDREAPPGEPGPARSSGLPAVQGRDGPAGASALPSGRLPRPDSRPVGRPPDPPSAQGRQPAPSTAKHLPGGPQDTAGASLSSPSPALAGYLASPPGPTLRLKLWNGIGAVDGKRVYVDGPVDVDWERKDLRWWFEYRASGAQRGPLKLRWELSKATFPAWGAWHPVSGFSLTGPVEGTKHFQVDLAPLAPRPPGWAQKATAMPKGALGRGGAATMPGAGGGGAPGKKKSAQKPQPAAGSPAGGPAAAQLAAGAASAPVAPALLSLYLRVVPVDAGGAPVGPASNAVELRFGPPEKQPAFSFDIAWPEVTFASYRAVRPYDFDWQCWVVASQDWVDPVSGQVIFPKGTKKNLCEKEDTDLVEDIIDAIGSFAEMLGDFVDWVSDTYASLKSELISAVASAIPGCSGSPPCEGALEMGLNAGLAAVGMPPDLPDFEQLQAMGEGYLVDMIAQQAAQTGVPFAEEAARAAVKEMIAQGKEAMTSGGGGSSLWIPDVSRQYKPLLVTLRVGNTLPKPTTADYLEVAETGSSRYLPRKVPVPPLDPQESYEIAVSLEPTQDPGAWMEEFSGAGSGPFGTLTTYVEELPKAQAAHTAWKNQYSQGHVKLKASMRPQFGSETGYHVPFEKTCQAGAPGGCLVQ
ncbi:MAG: DNA polymerase III subunit gamma/tau domain-containing protein [Deferrisomatales bacterium]